MPKFSKDFVSFHELAHQSVLLSSVIHVSVVAVRVSLTELFTHENTDKELEKMHKH